MSRGNPSRLNPAVSGRQYRLAEAVMRGTSRTPTRMPRRTAQEIIKRTPEALRRRYARINPSELERAAEMSAMFHGRPAREVEEIVEQFYEAGELCKIGPLSELWIIPAAAPAEADGRVPATVVKFRSPMPALASNWQGSQLYIVAGQQAMKLAEFGIRGAEARHEKVVLGELFAVTYITAKFHMRAEDRKPGPYIHKLGEEGGEMPLVVYDVPNAQLEIVGGSYEVKAEGIRN